jgi:(1->4)-alpha-D-glucan 1-alpha-D-glucosylmutase
VKQAVIARILALRRDHPAVFADGAYVPLKAEGPAAEHVIAYARAHADRAVLVVVPRLCAGLLPAGAVTPMLPPDVWIATHLPLPRSLSDRVWTDAMSGQDTRIGPVSRLDIAALLGKTPFAVWGV